MALQYLIVFIILAICLVWAGHQAYLTFTNIDSACKGCPLKQNCSRHDRQHRRYPQGCERKNR